MLNLEQELTKLKAEGIPQDFRDAVLAMYDRHEAAARAIDKADAKITKHQNILNRAYALRQRLVREYLHTDPAQFASALMGDILEMRARAERIRERGVSGTAALPEQAATGLPTPRRGSGDALPPLSHTTGKTKGTKQ